MSAPLTIPPDSPRIAVIGGGIAGATAVHRLHALGYRSVTLFEAEERVGGKMCTRIVDGLPQELGAVVISAAYATAMPEIRRLALTLSPITRPTHMDVERRSVVPMPVGRGLLGQLWKFRRFLARDKRRRASQGDTPVDPSLTQPFRAWAEAMGIPLVCEPLIPFVTSYGYGHLEDVPAEYVLRYMHAIDFDLVALHIAWCRLVPAWFPWQSPFMRTIAGGVQRLPERLLAGCDVRLDARVTRIERHDDFALTYGSDGQTERFDRVVFATLPIGIDGLERILPADVRATFASVRHYRYTAILCRAEGVPFGSYYHDVAKGRIFAPSNDRIAITARRHAESNCCVLYHLSDRFVADDELMRIVHAGLAEIGASLLDVLEIKRWTYFPHFDEATLVTGPFATIEAAQGVDNVYYLGSFLDFETIENSMATATRVIDRHFTPVSRAEKT